MPAEGIRQLELGVDGNLVGIAKQLQRRYLDDVGIRRWRMLIADFDIFTEKLEGATNRARTEQYKSLSAQIALLKGVFEGLSIAIGGLIADELRPLVTEAAVLAKEWIPKLVEAMDDIDRTTKRIAIAFGGMLGLLATARVALGFLAPALTGVLGPLALLTTAAGAFVER